ncbi:MAG: hypothetical protein ACOC4L_03740 [Halanaerobium sp.]
MKKMTKKTNNDILLKSFNNLNKSQTKRLLKYYERKWIENNKNINVFNYWYYRYFTNKFIKFLIYFRLDKEFNKKLDEDKG